MTTLNAHEAITESDAEFRRSLATLTVRELRDRYRGEAYSHRRMLADEAKGVCMVHPAFRSFKDFLRHVGPKGEASRTLDRIDPHDDEYGPGKVRWATKREQANNRRNTTLIRDRMGTPRPLTVVAEMIGVSPETLRSRKRRGLTAEEAVAGKRARGGDGLPLRPSEHPRAPENLSQMRGNIWPSNIPQKLRDKWEKSYPSFRKRVLTLIPNREGRWLASRPVLAVRLLDDGMDRAEKWLDVHYPAWRDPEGPFPAGIEETEALKFHRAAPEMRLAAVRLIEQICRGTPDAQGWLAKLTRELRNAPRRGDGDDILG